MENQAFFGKCSSAGFCLLVLIVSNCVLPGCTSEIEVIRPVDPRSLVVSATSKDEASRAAKNFIDQLYANTVGKQFPQIEVQDENGDAFTIQGVLPDQCILVSGELSCAAGAIGLLEDFPKAVATMENDVQTPEVICFLIRMPYYTDKPHELKGDLEELKEIYTAVYLIEEQDALKINAYLSFCRFYIKNNVVMHVAFGMSDHVYLTQEIKRFIPELMEP